MPLVEETLLLAPEGMVTLTALKWTGVSPTVGNLVEATTVRAVAGAAGGVCPRAGAASAATQTKKPPMVVGCMWLSLNKFILSEAGFDIETCHAISIGRRSRRLIPSRRRRIEVHPYYA